MGPDHGLTTGAALGASRVGARPVRGSGIMADAALIGRSSGACRPRRPACPCPVVVILRRLQTPRGAATTPHVAVRASLPKGVADDVPCVGASSGRGADRPGGEVQHVPSDMGDHPVPVDDHVLGHARPRHGLRIARGVQREF
jgi:hypothetical protein